jgi:hypothetical protein
LCYMGLGHFATVDSCSVTFKELNK